MRWEVLKIVEARDGFSANIVEQSEPKPAVRSFDAPRTFVNSSFPRERTISLHHGLLLT